MKAIYHVLNQFSLRDAQRVLIGECWMPTADIPAIKNAITTGTYLSFKRYQLSVCARLIERGGEDTVKMQ